MKTLTKYKRLEEKTSKEFDGKDLKRLQKKYNDAFTFSFINFKGGDYDINIYWFNDKTDIISPSFSPYDGNRTEHPIYYNLNRQGARRYKTIKDIIDFRAKQFLR